MTPSPPTETIVLPRDGAERLRTAHRGLLAAEAAAAAAQGALARAQAEHSAASAAVATAVDAALI